MYLAACKAADGQWGSMQGTSNQMVALDNPARKHAFNDADNLFICIKAAGNTMLNQRKASSYEVQFRLIQQLSIFIALK